MFIIGSNGRVNSRFSSNILAEPPSSPLEFSEKFLLSRFRMLCRFGDGTFGFLGVVWVSLLFWFAEVVACLCRDSEPKDLCLSIYPTPDGPT